ncbi:MAG TPA: hypothetical protein VKP30_15930, partial [Polyangiaceae bacterium]|nr:hypothetical protein [Polyangiaceae bacterium]
TPPCGIGHDSETHAFTQADPPLLPFARSSLAASTNLGGASTRGASAVVGSKTFAAFTASAALLAERAWCMPSFAVHRGPFAEFSAAWTILLRGASVLALSLRETNGSAFQ